MTVAVRKTHAIVRKRTKKFARFQSDSFMRVGESWRKPRGIDNRCRRRFRGTKIMPGKGFKNDKTTRYLNKQNGMFTFRIETLKDIEMLLMHNKKYAGVVAKQVSRRNRKLMLERAEQLGVKLLNVKAGMVAEETE